MITGAGFGESSAELVAGDVDGTALRADDEEGAEVDEVDDAG